MDVSVSRLNQRMALQLPAELPLGLVFVVGEVHKLRSASDDGNQPSFYLIDKKHQLRCCLSDRTAEESKVVEGSRIRAGGHLAFDPRQADYYLYVRDVEILADQPPPIAPPPSTVDPLLKDLSNRSEVASLATAEMPIWVKQMAPLEVQPEIELTEDEQRGELPEPIADGDPSEMAKDFSPDPAVAPDSLPPELLAFLSEAMDSPEEVELTPELMAELAPAIRPEPVQIEASEADDAISEPAQIQVSSEIQAATETRVSWLVVILVLLALFIFLGAMLVLAVNLTGGG